MRDPKIDPAAGDVLCSAKSTSMIIVTGVGEFVTYTLRCEQYPDATCSTSLADWRETAAQTDVVSRADKIASLEAEREASIAAHEKRMASLGASLAFLRGEK